MIKRIFSLIALVAAVSLFNFLAVAEDDDCDVLTGQVCVEKSADGKITKITLKSVQKDEDGETTVTIYNVTIDANSTKMAQTAAGKEVKVTGIVTTKENDDETTEQWVSVKSFELATAAKAASADNDSDE